MAFRDFTFPEVVGALGLRTRQQELFHSIEPALVPTAFLSYLNTGQRVARVNDNEKARSEFLIALVLLELRQRFHEQFGLFSGYELNADPARGLNGICDFILTASPDEFVPVAPLILVVEAKSNSVRTGYAQCIAAMVAARLVNERAENPSPAYVGEIHGVVSTGSDWQFLRLTGTDIVFDTAEHYISEIGKILAIFETILRRAGITPLPPAVQAAS